MATSITSNTYRIEIKETFLLDGVKRGSRVITKNLTCGEIATRLMSVESDTGGTVIANFAATAALGQFDKDNFKYLRITNLDANNNLILHLEEASASHDTQLVVRPLNSFILSSLIIDNVAGIDSAVHEGGSELLIDKITGLADNADIDIELVIVTT
jgi:hypothetical protein